jgi:hypothetical protein
MAAQAVTHSLAPAVPAAAVKELLVVLLARQV